MRGPAGPLAARHPYRRWQKTGAMTGMNDGPSAFGWNESYLWSDPFGASLSATERSSTATAPRTRAKSTKAKTKVKRRVTRAQGASH